MEELEESGDRDPLNPPTKCTTTLTNVGCRMRARTIDNFFMNYNGDLFAQRGLRLNRSLNLTGELGSTVLHVVAERI